MDSQSKAFVGVLIVIALGIGWIALGRGGSQSAGGSSLVGLQEGNISPAFEVTTIDGTIVNSDNLRGRVVVMTSSAAWCPTCVIEAQQFVPVYEKYKDQSVTFLTIDIDPNVTVEQIEQFRQDNNTPWAYAQAVGAAQWIQDYNINRFEITYVIDQQGIIRFKDREITATEKLEQAIQPLL